MKRRRARSFVRQAAAAQGQNRSRIYASWPGCVASQHLSEATPYGRKWRNKTAPGSARQVTGHTADSSRCQPGCTYWELIEQQMRKANASVTAARRSRAARRLKRSKSQNRLLLLYICWAELTSTPEKLPGNAARQQNTRGVPWNASSSSQQHATRLSPSETGSQRKLQHEPRKGAM